RRLLGPGVAAAAPSLRLLCLAIAVNAGASVNTSLLIMTGHERAAAAAATAGVLCTVLGCLVLVGGMGATGGAAAFLAGTVLRNVLACALTWRELGLRSSVLAGWGASTPLRLREQRRSAG